MKPIKDYPLLVFVLSFLLMWISSRIGGFFKKRKKLEDQTRDDFSIILGSMLTLLALIIAFSFSMAISRYDQRKNYEEAEANAIGTEYVRADILPAKDAERVRMLLKIYLDHRIQFYETRDEQELFQINARTAKLQNDLWSAILEPVAIYPTPPMALVASGMNDVLNSQGYTQAAWWNRIPRAAWVLMIVMAMCCNSVAGYGMRDSKTERILCLLLPFVLAITFFLISDIDSPRAYGGVINILPENLIALAASLP